MFSGHITCGLFGSFINGICWGGGGGGGGIWLLSLTHKMLSQCYCCVHFFLQQSALSCEDDEDEDGDCGISEEDIRMFQANRSTLQQKRMELRENLKRRFQHMRQQHGASPLSSPSSSPSPSPHLASRFQHQ